MASRLIDLFVSPPLPVPSSSTPADELCLTPGVESGLGLSGHRALALQLAAMATVKWDQQGVT